VSEGKFYKHIRFAEPLAVRMDGKKRISVITVNDPGENEF
jgi:hypothetical protein